LLVSEAGYLSGQDAAELHQTVGMITGYLKDAYRLLRNVRNLRINAAGLSSRELGNQWLRYRYGLRPLVLSIQQAVEAARSIGHPQRSTSRGFKKLYGSAVTDFGTSICNTPGWGFAWDLEGLWETEVLVRAGVLFENTTDGTSLQRAFGLRVDDILPTVWELVKYSFVLDWFCNIGQVVRAWTPHSEAEVLTCWVKTTRLDRKTLTISNVMPSPTYQESGRTKISLEASGSGGGEVRESLSVTRTARPDKPIWPHINLRVDMSKLIDILALIRQLNG